MKSHESQASLVEVPGARLAAQPEELDFEAILRETQPRIRAYIAGMGIASHEVDDVAQDVYLELYRGLDRVPPGVAPERWLKGIARNLCLNHIRRSARRGRLHREAIIEILAQTNWEGDEPGMYDSVQQALEGCYNKLPDQSRRMLVMRYQSDLPSADIATAFESTAEAVRVALYRIRAGLKDCISRRLARETKL